MRPAYLSLFILSVVLWGCAHTLPSGEVKVIGPDEGAAPFAAKDTLKYQKYHVAVEMVYAGSLDPDDSSSTMVEHYHVMFWTRDDTGELQRHRALLQYSKGKVHYTHAHYRWQTDSTLFVRLESEEGDPHREMYLLGWKGRSGMSDAPTDWKPREPVDESIIE